MHAMKNYETRYATNGNGKNNGDHKNGRKEPLVENPMSIVENLPLDDLFSSPSFLRTYELDLPTVDTERIEQAVSEILSAVGEDVNREGLLNTPHRVAKAYVELLGGYRVDPSKVINNAIFESDADDMVVVRDIEYFSMCEHHMLPFMGHAYVAYIPNGKIIGLSKIPRIVDMFSQRLQVQERLTRQIAEFISHVLDAKGVAVVMDGVHMCSMMRGVEKIHSGMTTSVFMGAFKTDKSLRDEFMSHIQRAGGKKALF